MSGSGTNAERLLRDWRTGVHTSWNPCVIATDRPKMCFRAQELAEEYGLPCVSLDLHEFYRVRGLEKTILDSPRALEIRDEWTDELWHTIQPFHPDFGLLAGFVPLSNITTCLPCLNVHPGDLTVEEDGRRFFTGLHREPTENAILKGFPHIRSSVILAQAFHAAEGDIDGGPILGISEALPLDLGGHAREEFEECKAARAGKKAAEYKNDLLACTALANIEVLKKRGDQIVFPQAADDFASGKFDLDADGGLLYCGEPVQTVEYSEKEPPKPVKRTCKIRE